jgi:hypothetical protein
MKRLTRRQKIGLSSSVVILLTLLLFLFSKDFIVSANRNGSIKKTPDLLGPFANEIAIQETNVAKSPNDEVRKGEENRLQMIGREATIVAEARDLEATYGSHALPVESLKLTSQALGEIGQQQWGLIENPSVPGSGTVFRAENAWKQDMGDGYILIIAGYSPANPDNGILLVDINRKNIITSRTFTIPGIRGSIRIVKAVGMRLVLETNNKDTLYFDVPGLRFVSSLEEVVPTATELSPEITPVFTNTPLPPYP